MATHVRLMRPEDHDGVVALKWELNQFEITRMPDAHPLKADRDPSRAWPSGWIELEVLSKMSAL